VGLEADRRDVGPMHGAGIVLRLGA
jgi:hypothetical protein